MVFYAWGHQGLILLVHFVTNGKYHRTSVMCEFSASRHFFKTNVTQSVAELILYSKKTQNCGHFLSNLVN